MSKEYMNAMLMRVMKLLYILVANGLFIGFWVLYYARHIEVDAASNSSILVCIVYVMCNLYLCRVYNAFNVGMARVAELTYSQSLAVLISWGFLYVLVSILWGIFVNPLPILVIFMIQTLFSMLWSLCANKLYFTTNRPKRTTIIYRREDDLQKIRSLRYFKQRFDVFQCIEYVQGLEDRFEQVAENNEVIFAIGLEAEFRDRITQHCLKNNIQGYVSLSISDIVISNSKLLHTFKMPIARVERAFPTPEYLAIKRLFDVIVSFTAIVLLFPLMAIIALLIKLEDGGSVIYKQKRLTQNGKIFTIIKFRSMHPNAEEDGIACLANEDDSRITVVGKQLRRFRLDEIPQFFNVLKGDMSIVGPRPERPEIAELYEKQIPGFSLRLQAKAGITGLAQVHGRYDTEPEDKLQMDLMYIHKMSLAHDVKLMFATLKVLLETKRTYGVKGRRETVVYFRKRQENERV